jgi:hypothetical protein
LLSIALALSVAAAGPPATGLPENDAVKVLTVQQVPCGSDSTTQCVRVTAQCKLKRRVSNWSKSLVAIVWHDVGGAPGFTAGKGFDACRGEPGGQFIVEFPWPPAGFSYSIELP